MKKILAVVMTALTITGSALAREIITIKSPYSPSHSGTPAMFRIIDEANRSQDRYRFILEFKPGGEQIIAVKNMDESPTNSLAIVAPKYVEHLASKKLNRDDYVPVYALGDACWAVITNVGDETQGVASLRGTKELVVGGVGFGNAAHLTALQLAEKYQFQVLYVPFKSNFDALILMAGDGSVNMVLDRVSSYQQFKAKNPNLKMLAMSCPTRHPDAPSVRTLKEQGIQAPYVFNIVVANRAMPDARRQELSAILEKATQTVGQKTIQQLSDMHPPVFNNQSVTVYYQESLALVDTLLARHKNKIDQGIAGKQ
jgi:tripartite-type tricarboxylate transporter receptor subunit TctC